MNLLSKIALGIIIILIQSVSIADEVNPILLGWVGFWNEDMVEWAENQNRISRLCTGNLSEEELSKCIEIKLDEKKWTINVYKQPKMKSKKFGEIIITIKPGNPFQSSFKTNSNKPFNFIPDLYDQDWGYGPNFHQTILDRKGDWVKIALPAPYSSAWINPKADIQKLDIVSIQQGLVYKLGSESIVIVEIKKDIMKYRMETEADVSCEGPDPALNKTENIKTIKVKELFKNGHLELDLKYKRGC